MGKYRNKNRHNLRYKVGGKGKPGGKFLKKSLNWGGMPSKGFWLLFVSLGFCTVNTLTTLGDLLSTKSAKLSDSGWPSTLTKLKNR